jgi:hypothetical protein
MCFYFLLFGRSALLLQLRQRTFPWETFKLGARSFDLHDLHTKMFFNNRAVASSFLTILFHLFHYMDAHDLPI